MSRLSARAHSFASMIGLRSPALAAVTTAAAKAGEDEARKAAENDPEDSDKPKGPDAAAAADSEAEDCPECDGDGEDDDGKACKACDGTGKVGADDDEDAPEGRKGRKAAGKKADDDMEEGRKAERKRWGYVLAKAIPANKTVAACALLHDTPMTAAKIVATLAALPAETAPKASTIDDRMRAANTPRISPDAPEAPKTGKSEAKALADRILATTNKALGRAPAA